jgi:anti-sigma B factor antagonist
MLLTIEEKRIVPDIDHIAIAGKLTIGRESQRLEKLLEDLVKNGSRKVVLDMTKLDYIDSSGIGILAHVAGRMKVAEGRFVIALQEGRVRHILRIAQIDAVVPVNATVELAASAIS